nr:hypothetical protein [Salmonid herpesvirus 1]
MNQKFIVPVTAPEYKTWLSSRKYPPGRTIDPLIGDNLDDLHSFILGPKELSRREVYKLQLMICMLHPQLVFGQDKLSVHLKSTGPLKCGCSRRQLYETERPALATSNRALYGLLSLSYALNTPPLEGRRCKKAASPDQSFQGDSRYRCTACTIVPGTSVCSQGHMLCWMCVGGDRVCPLCGVKVVIKIQFRDPM